MAIGNKAGAGVGAGTGAAQRPTNAPPPGLVKVSLKAENFSQGGLVDDVDVLIKDIRWCFYDYQGKSYQGDALVLGAELEEIHSGADGKKLVHEQYFSAGDKAYFRPSEQAVDGVPDGGYLIPTQDRKQLNQNTNAAIFLTSLQAAQFPADRLENMTITEALVGAVIHINRIAQPKRQGLIKKTRGGGDGQPEKERDVIICTKVISLPGQVPMPMPVQAAVNTSHPQPIANQLQQGNQQAPAQPTNGAASDEVRLAAIEALGNILMENGGTVTKAQLPTLAFKALMKHPLKAKVVPMVYSDEFLSSVGSVTIDGTELPVRFDGATVAM